MCHGAIICESDTLQWGPRTMWSTLLPSRSYTLYLPTLDGDFPNRVNPCQVEKIIDRAENPDSQKSGRTWPSGLKKVKWGKYLARY
jgi:hypothetical protein